MNNPLNDLCFPEYYFRIKKDSEKIFIFDELRKKWIICTPEEWVRQNLIKFLITELNFPKNFIAIEKSLQLAGRTYRFDALVYDKNFKPLIIIECKAPKVNLGQKTFDQIWNYNYEVSAEYFIVTNGVSFIMGRCSKSIGVSFFENTITYEEILKLSM